MAKKTEGLSKKAAKKWKAKLKEARKREKKAAKKQLEQRDAYLKQWKKLKKKIKPFKKAYSNAKKKHKKKKKEYLALLEQWQVLNTPPGATQEIEEVLTEPTSIEEKVLPVEEFTSPSRDDLKKIEGIGPKIEEHLNRAGLLSYIDLATASLDFLKETLHNAGPNYRLHDPTTWPRQATLAAEGQWEALQALQNELKGGRL